MERLSPHRVTVWFYGIALGSLIVAFSFVHLHAINLTVTHAAPTGQHVDLALCLAPGEMVYKESLRISADDPGCQVVRWETEAEAVVEHVVPLKLHKEVYKESLAIRAFLAPRGGCACDPSIYLSCFVVENDEAIVPFVKKVQLRCPPPPPAPALSLTTTLATPVSPATVVQIPAPPVSPTPSARAFPFWFFNTRFLALLILLFLLLSFIIVNVLSFCDVGGLLLLGSWGYFARPVLPYRAYLAISLLLVCVLTVWYAKDHEDCSSWSLIVRSILALLCASAVVPLLVELGISWWFG